MNVKQFADGSLGIQSSTEGISLLRVGGPKASGTVPNFRGTQWLKLTANGGVNTPGGLTLWQNTLGFDIIVTGVILDVTAVTPAPCFVMYGVSVDGTTYDGTFLITDVHTATTTVSATVPPATKVPVNTFITGSVDVGIPAGLVANLYVQFIAA